MPRITLRQIAERIGCSRSTVSYALRNSPYISQEMRDKVLKVAAELGWRPNATLNLQMASIRQTATNKRVPTLAMVLNISETKLGVNNAPSLQIDGVRRRAKELGFNLDEFNLIDSPLSPNRLRDIVKARGIEGIIFIGSLEPPISMDYLEIGKEFTCVVCGIRYPEIPFHVTVPDFLAAGKMCIDEIVKSGYERPAVFIPSAIDKPLNWGFSGGAYTGIMELPFKNRLPIYIIDFEADDPEFRDRTILNWIDEHEPDSILSLGAQFLVQLVKASDDWKSQIPHFSYDWYPDQKVEAGIDLMQRDVGKAAVDMVVDQLSKGESSIPKIQKSINIEGVWASKD